MGLNLTMLSVALFGNEGAEHIEEEDLVEQTGNMVRSSSGRGAFGQNENKETVWQHERRQSALVRYLPVLQQS